LVGCSTNAVAIRWHRSIKFLRGHLTDADAQVPPASLELPFNDLRQEL
jgi:hypothetical protein